MKKLFNSRIYLTCFAPDGTERPCNIPTRRWGWLYRLINKTKKENSVQFSFPWTIFIIRLIGITVWVLTSDVLGGVLVGGAEIINLRWYFIKRKKVQGYK
jgi:hypothetical protein